MTTMRRWLRIAAIAEKRSELDLQISLLAEHEITKIVQIVSQVAERLGIDVDQEVEELERNVAPEAVLYEIEGQQDARHDG